MFKELDACILDARFDNDVRVLVITGHGGSYFSAGVDPNMLREADPTFKYYFYLHATETLGRLEQTPKLVIAALNGHAVGGGLEIALACDLRIAREGAYDLSLADANLGALTGMGGTQRLSRLVGPARAMEMLIEAKTMPLDEALLTGLVHKVWEEPDHEAFMRRVVDYAHEFTPPKRASVAIGNIKRAVQGGADMSLDQGLALERELHAALFGSEDVKEGLAAYAQKRTPVFRGR
jgi:enoyl-CoA hydratase/carnithine racemase